MSRRRVALLVFIGALALLVVYPPFRLPILSFVVLTPAVLLLRQAERDGSPRNAFRWGFWYGLVSQALVLYWLVVALWHFTALSALGYLATIAGMGFFTAACFWFVIRVRLRVPRLPLWILLPVAWTTMEWTIGHVGDVAFPWLGIGTSLTDAPVLVQWADVAGARGIGFWLIACNVALAEGALGGGKGAWRRMALPRFAAVAATVLAAWGYGTWRTHTLPMRRAGVVGLIQPNIGFDEKWEAVRADSEVDLMLALSARARAQGRPDLIAWPEAALPGYLFEQARWDTLLARFAREGRTPMLVGGLHATFPADGSSPDIYNAAFYFDSTGVWRSHPVYEKSYLVPVVERTPFVPASWFRRIPGIRNWAGRFRPGTELPLYPSPVGRLGVLVCYESTFEDLARRYRAEGAQVLVNITNDAWYGRTTAPYQHAAHLVMRAIETRMGIARSANDGVSEFVDPLGHVTDASILGTQAVVVGTLVTSDVVPPYVRLGDWVGWLSVLATLGLAGWTLPRWGRGKTEGIPPERSDAP